MGARLGRYAACLILPTPDEEPRQALGTLRPCRSTAGRGPAVYDDPDRFDVLRNLSDAMMMGQGTHYALTAPGSPGPSGVKA